MTKILCPYCFKSFDKYEVKVQCQNEGKELKTDEFGNYKPESVCPVEDDQLFSNYRGQHVMIHHVFDYRPSFKEKFGRNSQIQEKNCPKCGAPSQKYVCPHCHNWLPTEMIEKGSEIISVVGGPESGKTNYIVALIHELQKYAGRLNLKVTLQQVGYDEKEKTLNLYESAKEKLFGQHQRLDKTEENRRPTPWIIRVQSRETEKAVYLVFYDTAGESFKDPEKIKRDALYFKESKAVIVAFDTLAIPTIKNVLHEKNIIKKDNNTAYDYKMMLTTVMNYANEYRALKLTKRPYAFVFTKFDAVIDNADALNCSVDVFVDENGDFKNSSYLDEGQGGVVDMAEFNECSDAISSYLHASDIWDEDSFAADIEGEWKDNGCFFGVSALGGMVDETGSIQKKGEVVSPIKVLDPLVWILIKLGGFGIKTK